MAPVVTSYTPTTGPISGGTLCTITGTGLSTVTVVLVGNRAATIVGTPTATQVKFLTPSGAAVGTAKVTVVDVAANLEAQAGTDFTYTALASGTETLVTTLAKKWRLDVSTDGGTTWVKVRGVKTFKPVVNSTTEDDTDFDSGNWGADLKTLLKWQIDMDVKRGLGAVTGTYDPGQEVLRAASENMGVAGTALARWYDRNGGPEAYTGTAQVTWAPNGGGATADVVSVSLLGQSARTTVANPVLADPSLAA